MRALLVLVITLLSVYVEAAPVNLLGRTINLIIPEGYCEAGGHPAETKLVNRIRKAMGTSNQILALFADCKELDDLRKGRRAALDNYGLILAQTPKGQLRPLKGVSRSEYIQMIRAQIGHVPDGLKEAEARIKQYFPAMLQSYENLGLLGTDSNGLYVGLLQTWIDDTGRPKPLLGVVGTTLIKKLTFSINLYQAYRNSPDLRGLLARQQTAMANFVANN